MKVARFVDVIQTMNNLTKNGGDEPTSERTAATRLDKLKKMALHWLEDEIEFLGVWKKK